MSMPDKWEYPWFAAWDLGVPLRRAGPRRPGVRQVPADPDLPGVVPAPERRAARLRVGLRRRQPAGAGVGGARGVRHRRRPRPRLPQPGLRQAAGQLHLVGQPGGRGRATTCSRAASSGSTTSARSTGRTCRSGGTLEQSDATGWMASYALAMGDDRARSCTAPASGRRSTSSSSSSSTSPPSATRSTTRACGTRPTACSTTSWSRRTAPRAGQGALDGRHHPAARRRGRRRARCSTGPSALGKQFADFLERQGLDDPDKLRRLGLLRGEPGQRAAAARRRRLDRLEKLFARLFDEDEFLSPYGLRAMSAFHREHPYELDVEGIRRHDRLRAGRVDDRDVRRQLQLAGPDLVPAQLPRRSAPRALPPVLRRRLHASSTRPAVGRRLPLDEIADDLRHRLISLFLVGPDGRRPCFGGVERLQTGPARGRTTSCSTSTSTATTAPASAPPTRPAGPGWSPTSSAAGTARSRPSATSSGRFQAGPVMTAVQDGGDAAVLPGSRFPLGATARRRRHQLRGRVERRRRHDAVPVRRRRPRDPGRRCGTTTPASGTASCPASGPGRPTATGPLGPYDPARGAALQPGQAAARPLRPGDHRRGHVRAGGARLRRRRPGRAERPRLGRPCAAQPRRRPALRLGRRRPPRRRYADTVIYEVHVKGFTMRPPRRARPSCAAPTPASATRPRSPTSSTSA